MYSVVFIVGPTAAGKTQAAFDIAKKTGAQIISCDSMLVYKEPRIITSKPPKYMLDEVRHHFVDIISVSESYDVYSYYTEALKLIADSYSKKVPVIICGGSGLYMKALLDGVFKGPSRNNELRASLESEARIKGNNVLHEKLKFVDPAAARKISPNDLKRIIRALEVYYTAGVPISEKQKEKEGIWGKFPVKIFGTGIERGRLYKRINERVNGMFNEGAVNEVNELIKLPLSVTAAKIIGISEIKGYLEGRYTYDEAKRLMAKNTRNFAKRQWAWFRRDKRIEWIDISDNAEDLENNILGILG